MLKKAKQKHGKFLSRTKMMTPFGNSTENVKLQVIKSNENTTSTTGYYIADHLLMSVLSEY